MRCKACGNKITALDILKTYFYENYLFENPDEYYFVCKKCKEPLIKTKHKKISFLLDSLYLAVVCFFFTYIRNIFLASAINAVLLLVSVVIDYHIMYYVEIRSENKKRSS